MRAHNKLYNVGINRRGRREGAKDAEKSLCDLCAFFALFAVSK